VTWPDCLGDPYELAITITEMERDIEKLKRRLERLEKIVDALAKRLEDVECWAIDGEDAREIAYEVAEKVVSESVRSEALYL